MTSPEEGEKFSATVAERLLGSPAISESDRAEVLGRTRLYVEQSCTYPVSPREI